MPTNSGTQTHFQSLFFFFFFSRIPNIKCLFALTLLRANVMYSSVFIQHVYFCDGRCVKNEEIPLRPMVEVLYLKQSIHSDV